MQQNSYQIYNIGGGFIVDFAHMTIGQGGGSGQIATSTLQEALNWICSNEYNKPEDELHVVYTARPYNIKITEQEEREEIPDRDRFF